MNKKLYAFWPYDLFPYTLGAEVEDIEGEVVILKGYGRYGFSNLTLVDYNTGAKLHTILMNLREEHRIESNELNEKFKKKAIKAFKDHNIQLTKNLKFYDEQLTGRIV